MAEKEISWFWKYPKLLDNLTLDSCKTKKYVYKFKNNTNNVFIVFNET